MFTPLGNTGLKSARLFLELTYWSKVGWDYPLRVQDSDWLIAAEVTGQHGALSGDLNCQILETFLDICGYTKLLLMKRVEMLWYEPKYSGEHIFKRVIWI